MSGKRLGNLTLPVLVAFLGIAANATRLSLGWGLSLSLARHAPADRAGGAVIAHGRKPRENLRRRPYTP